MDACRIGACAGATNRNHRLLCGLSHINHYCAPILIHTVDATQILSTLCHKQFRSRSSGFAVKISSNFAICNHINRKGPYVSD